MIVNKWNKGTISPYSILKNGLQKEALVYLWYVPADFCLNLVDKKWGESIVRRMLDRPLSRPPLKVQFFIPDDKWPSH